MIVAPDGMLRWYEMNRPPMQLTNPIGMASSIMCLNCLQNRFAVICGRVRSDITSTMPIILRHETIVRAMTVIIRYSMPSTGSRCERANSRSNAMATIGFSISAKSVPTKIVRMARSHRSLLVIVRMLPKRNDDRSARNPGVRNEKMMPMAMPNVQKTAIAESSRMSERWLNH